MSKSAYLGGKLLDHLYGGPDYTRPATVYVALFADAAFTELSGNGYARAAVTNNATNWPAASAGSKTNGAAITYSVATGDWSPAVGWGIYDAPAGGNLLRAEQLDAPVTVLSGATARFATGALVLTEVDGDV